MSGALTRPDPGFDARIRGQGYVVAHDVLTAAMCDTLRTAVDDAVAADAAWIADRPEEYGRVLSLVHYGRPFLELLDEEGLMSPFDRVLGDDCILYTMSTSCLPPGGEPRPVHVDFAEPSGDEVLFLAALVMLDDFTVANGATRFLPGSRGAERPEQHEFDRRAEVVEGRAGSVCWFDPRLWHAGGVNTTERWRRCILIGMVKRWMKPRFDHPAMLGSSASTLAPRVQRVLGFESRPPASYEEYYERGKVAAPGSATHPIRSSTS